jgi:Mn-dependent DtxR family transcriptional regulator
MQAAKTISTVSFERISEKELTILSEIGFDQIPTATSLVAYVAEKYEVSASGIWYTLKKLKKMGMLDFMEKGESYKPLMLTENGKSILRNRTNNAMQYRQVMRAMV